MVPYHVEFPPPWRSPVVQQVNQLFVVRSRSTTELDDRGAPYIADARFVQWSLPSLWTEHDEEPPDEGAAPEPPQFARPRAVGSASNPLVVSSAAAGTNPQLPWSSPCVRYHVVLPPACMSPVVQHENQLFVVRNVSTTELDDRGSRYTDDVRFVQKSFPDWTEHASPPPDVTFPEPPPDPTGTKIPGEPHPRATFPQ